MSLISSYHWQPLIDREVRVGGITWLTDSLRILERMHEIGAKTVREIGGWLRRKISIKDVFL